MIKEILYDTLTYITYKDLKAALCRFAVSKLAESPSYLLPTYCITLVWCVSQELQVDQLWQASVSYINSTQMMTFSTWDKGDLGMGMKACFDATLCPRF